jgi:mRNA-degrading endonuclease RelE of RelBE toxin-antitoxin system
MHVKLSNAADARLAKLPLDTQERITSKLRFFAAQPNPLTFAKFIAEKDAYRFRIGNYRVLFIIENNILKVAKIERRDKVYD